MKLMRGDGQTIGWMGLGELSDPNTAHYDRAMDGVYDGRKKDCSLKRVRTDGLSVSILNGWATQTSS